MVHWEDFIKRELCISFIKLHTWVPTRGQSLPQMLSQKLAEYLE